MIDNGSAASRGVTRAQPEELLPQVLRQAGCKPVEAIQDDSCSEVANSPNFQTESCFCFHKLLLRLRTGRWRQESPPWEPDASKMPPPALCPLWRPVWAICCILLARPQVATQAGTISLWVLSNVLAAPTQDGWGSSCGYLLCAAAAMKINAVCELQWSFLKCANHVWPC